MNDPHSNISTGAIDGLQEKGMDLQHETEAAEKNQNQQEKEQEHENQKEQQTNSHGQAEAIKPPDVVTIPISASDILPAAHGALSLASIATQFSFSLARQSTRLGFAIPRTIFSTLVPSQLSPLTSLIESSLNLAEFSAISAIQLADAISANSLQLASNSIAGVDQLCRAYSHPELPSLDALKLVLVLIRRHWGRLVPAELPGHPPGEMEPFKLLQTLKSLSTWALLQQLTQHIQARKLAPNLVHVLPRPATSPECLSETNEDTKMVLRKFQRYIDLCLSSYGGLGHVLFGSPHPPPPEQQRHASDQSAPASQAGPGPPAADPQPSSAPSSLHSGCEDSRLFPGSLVLDESAPVHLSHPPPIENQSNSITTSQSHNFKLWDLLTGKHDHDLLRQYGEVFEETDMTEMGSDDGASLVKELQTMMGDETCEGGGSSSGDEQVTLDWEKPPVGSSEDEDGSEGETVEWDFEGEYEDGSWRRDSSWTAAPCQTSANARPRPPRYFILLDRPNKTVILCLRGTFSIDDLATDLTCESTSFDPILYWDEPCWKQDGSDSKETTTKVRQTFEVHSGFKRVAEELISGILPPSHAPLTGESSGSGSVKRTRLMRSIWNVLEDSVNKSKDGLGDGSSGRTFEKLEIVGHSLGAGVGTLLGLMWADPRSGLTTKKGGLPSGIEVRVYGICPPCTTSKELTKISGPMIKSLVNSADLISRLSLGHVLDLRTMVGWIQIFEARPAELVAQVEGSGLGGGIWRRLLEIYGKRLGGIGGAVGDGALEPDDRWMMALRDRLESKTDQAELLVPTGTIYWIRHDGLVKVKEDKNEEVFRMIEFDSSMLRDHLGGRVKSQFERILNLSSSPSDLLETVTRVGTGGRAPDEQLQA